MSPQSQSNKVLVLKRSGSVHGGVTGPEAVSQPLDLDTDDDEVVQGQPPLSWTILAQKVLYKRW